jgi:hypothetical protein
LCELSSNLSNINEELKNEDEHLNVNERLFLGRKISSDPQKPENLFKSLNNSCSAEDLERLKHNESKLDNPITDSNGGGHNIW